MKFNKPGARARVGTTPIQTPAAPSVVNFQGGEGYTRDQLSELFILGVSNLVSEKTHHDSGLKRDERFTRLIQAVASQPENTPWLAGYLPWLRKKANMRTAPIMGALDAAAAMVAAGIPGSRQLIANSMDRADEPGEAMAYWFANYRRKLPKAVKRGIADAAQRLYTERSLLKYDTASHAFRFGDVIQLCHVVPATMNQSDLFKHALDRRHGRKIESIPLTLPIIIARFGAKNAAVEDLDEVTIKKAGMTWENTISKATTPAQKRVAWTQQIPSMGYMALLRNLRNIEQADLTEHVLNYVAAVIADPAQVARSRQFPFRFLSAAEAVNSLRWAWPLEQALQHSVSNVPELSGNTLIMVDCSGSMSYLNSGHSQMNMRQIAGLFGSALYLRNHGRATLVRYGNSSTEVTASPGTSILKLATSAFPDMGGTETAKAIGQRLTNAHSRVILITDEQHHGMPPHTVVPPEIPLYVFNLVGHQYGSMPTNANRVTIGGGLTDGAFKVISLLEAGRNGTWPWESEDDETDGD
jgi:hypothetical protein